MASRTTSRRIGFGRLVASSTKSTNTNTSLTTLCHQAPLRWIPVINKNHTAAKANANNVGLGSLVYQCHYGGGFLSTDKVVTDVFVQSHARLGIMTQGHNPIYTASNTTSNDDSSYCASYKANYKIESNGLLVVAPDPIRVHKQSKYQQDIRIELSSNKSNLCYVDWISAGRISQKEIWKHSYFQTTTKVFCNSNDNKEIPIMVDSVEYESMLLQSDDTSFDPYMGYNAFVTVLLHGPMIQSVVNRCEQIQRRILLLETNNNSSGNLRIRKTKLSDNEDDEKDQQEEVVSQQHQQQLLQTLSPGGNVVMSISEVPVNTDDDNDNNSSNSSLYVARLAATSNEDLYRILYYCLQPLSHHFFPGGRGSGHGGSSNNNNKSFYGDRIRAVHSSSSTSKSKTTTDTKKTLTSPTNDKEERSDGGIQQHEPSPLSSSLLLPSSSSASNLWSACMVVDSALPVGGFAHSGGIEAASQILNNNNMMGSRNKGSINLDTSETVAWTWIRMATQSASKFNTPIVLQCHSWTKQALQEEELVGSTSTATTTSWWLIDQWEELDRHVHSRLVSNPPACRASLDQGKNLLRVAQPWLRSSSSSSNENTRAQLRVLEAISQRVAGNKQPCGHLSTIFGVVTALLQLDADQACHLLAYTVARDIVSAAVRLNLIGPIASVHLLANTQQAANRCILDGKQAYEEALLPSSSPSSLTSDAATSSITPATTTAAAVAAEAAITCAPLLDCIQPCHDLLAVRLFRT